MIKRLEIEGLRGFASRGALTPAMPLGSEGSGLTVITGPNNSGKTTVIEAFRVFASVNADPSFHAGMRNAKSDAVNLSLYVGDDVFTVKSRSPGKSETEYPTKTSVIPYIVPSRRQFSPFFGKTSPTSRDFFARTFSSHSEIRSSSLSYFEGRIFEIEQDQSEYNGVLRRVIPELLDWSIDQSEQGQYYIKAKYENKTHNLQNSGDGVLSAFVIAASLFDSVAGNVIVIDEPELSLHPRLQKNLIALIEEYSSDRQIVISTHSPYFISKRSLQNGGCVARVWDRAGEVEICHVTRDSCPGLSTLTGENINNPHMFGLDAREIFFEVDPILLFEGQEDVVLWPKVDPHGKLDSASIFGWGSGGASNMIHLCEVLHGLGHRKVCGILDDNRPADIANLRAKYPDYLFLEIPASDIRSKKAVKARDEVHGLVDSSGAVRADLKPAIETLLDQAGSYFAA